MQRAALYVLVFETHTALHFKYTGICILATHSGVVIYRRIYVNEKHWSTLAIITVEFLSYLEAHKNIQLQTIGAISACVWPELLSDRLTQL